MSESMVSKIAEVLPAASRRTVEDIASTSPEIGQAETSQALLDALDFSRHPAARQLASLTRQVGPELENREAKQ